MKRTTYIIFGMLLTGLVVVCAGYSTPLRKLQVGIIFSWILKEKRRLFNYRSAELYRWWRLEISSLRVRAKKRE